MTELGVIEKIKKLFNLAQRRVNNDGTTNEAEAAAAMQMAQTLLTKYNLDVKMVQDTVLPGANPEQAAGKREKVQVKKSAMYRWQRQFWHDLAEANYCWHWVVDTVEFRWGKNRNVKRHVVLGNEVNVAVVQVMGDYLCETIERILPYPKNECLSKSANSWREGCAVRLIERIQENMERMKREGVTVDGASCTALAVQDLHVKEYAANYDATYGAGSYARMKKHQAEWEVRRQQEKEARARILAAETPEQRAEREKREAAHEGKRAAARVRDWERYQRRHEREMAKRDVAAYARGFHKANEINLDPQLKKEGGK